MLVSINWIKEFVDLPEISGKEIGEKFTLGSAEVENVNLVGQHLLNMCVAQVTKIEPHPNADKLKLVSFESFNGEVKRVVCGAHNVKVGMKTAFAPVGTVLPGDFELVPKKIRGVISEGMLCSESELGLSEDADGIIEFEESAPVGQRLDEFFKEGADILLDIDNKSLTHRPDLWGHYGLARDFSAIFKSLLKNPYHGEWAEEIKKSFTTDAHPVSVELAGESACKGYFGVTVENITVGESPLWMQSRLKLLGLRPINSIVDISNYVMLELGIPNHIFDRDKLAGNKVTIKRLDQKTEFVTLDGETRHLISGDTVICDADGIQVLAGIMGGLKSGVSEETKTLFIEVANWNPSEIRRTSTRLGLRTDSSQRYEKSLDSNLMERSLFRILDLICQLCPGAKVVGSPDYKGEEFWKETPLVETVTLEKIQSVLGIDISAERVVSILESLSFKTTYSEKSGEFSVEVPSFRATKDVEYADDIIEEVGRIIGYDNIPAQSPSLEVIPVRLSPARLLYRKISDFLVYHANSYEVFTYPLIGEKLLKDAQWAQSSHFHLLNALSSDHDRMRNSLIPSLLEVAALNSKNMNHFCAFEIGRSYFRDLSDEWVEEKTQLGIMIFDRKENTFMESINLTERLLDRIGVSGDICDPHPKFKSPLTNEDWPGLHPFERQDIKIRGKINGISFSVHPLILRKFKIKGHLSMVVLDLSTIENQPLKEKRNYKPIPKFSDSKFDCKVQVSNETQIGGIIKQITKAKIKHRDHVEVVDIFPIDQSQKAVTLRITFRDPSGTLEGDVLNQAQNDVVKSLENGGFFLRA